MASITNQNVLQYDKRVMQRMVSEGKLSREDAEAHLKALPDLADQCDDIADLVYGDINAGDENGSKQG